jgi:hypothetical protein
VGHLSLVENSRNVNNHSALLPTLNKTATSNPGSTKNATLHQSSSKLMNTMGKTMKQSYSKVEIVDKAPKSIKTLFEKLEFQMAEGENQDGAAKKEAFDRKMRVFNITEQEKKRYIPK